MKTLTSALVASLVAFSAGSAHAYTLMLTADGDPIKHFSTPTFKTVGLTDTERSRANWAKNRWQNGAMAFSATVEADNDSTASLTNTEYEIFFTTDADILGGAPAITHTTYFTATGEISKQDIAIDSDVDWTTSWTHTGVYAYNTADPRQLQGTLLHEFGHVFGVSEEGSEPSIMGQDWDHVAVSSGSVYPTIGGDSMAGAVEVYGEDSNILDTGVIHWKYDGASGNYSKHTQTQAYRSMAKLAFPTATDAAIGMTVFTVPAGKPIVVEFVYENMGSNCETMTLDWYSSTNWTMATTDTKLTTTSWQVCPGNDSEAMTVVTIPAGTSGRRYVGPIIVNAETGDSAKNNSSWLPLNVVPEGHADFCKASKNCAKGEGDCDSNSECASGLTCTEEGATDRCR